MPFNCSRFDPIWITLSALSWCLMPKFGFCSCCCCCCCSSLAKRSPKRLAGWLAWLSWQATLRSAWNCDGWNQPYSSDTAPRRSPRQQGSPGVPGSPLRALRCPHPHSCSGLRWDSCVPHPAFFFLPNPDTCRSSPHPETKFPPLQPSDPCPCQLRHPPAPWLPAQHPPGVVASSRMKAMVRRILLLVVCAYTRERERVCV